MSKEDEVYLSGGFYRPLKTIFEELSYFGINCKNRVYPWFIVYDFEAPLHNVQDQRSEKVEWTHEHMPISVSICSNVPGFEEPNCLVNDNGDELVREMVGYMKDIAEKTELLAKERWGRELGELKHRTKNSVSSMEVGEDEEDKEEDDEAKKITNCMVSLMLMCHRFPCWDLIRPNTISI